MFNFKNISALKAGFILAGLTLMSSPAFAIDPKESWKDLSVAFFPDKNIVSDNVVKVDSPVRAESGSQVPLTIFPASDTSKIWVLVDGNPMPLVGEYTLLAPITSFEIRFRMEIDSHVRVLSESSSGSLHMTDVVIKASGGCGGGVMDDPAIARESAGKLKLKVKEDLVVGMIKHPMWTGLQKDLVSGGTRPAWWVETVKLSHNDKVLFKAKLGVGTSEDPYFRFKFPSPIEKGTLKWEVWDNEAKKWDTSTEVSEPTP